MSDRSGGHKRTGPYLALVLGGVLREPIRCSAFAPPGTTVMSCAGLIHVVTYGLN